MSTQNILSLAIKDKSALYAAYMPYIINGGLFIPTEKTFTLGEDVFMLLTLVGSKERMPVSGKVIWKTPKGSQSGKSSGVGVQFATIDNGATKNKIETILAGAVMANKSNHTM